MNLARLDWQPAISCEEQREQQPNAAKKMTGVCSVSRSSAFSERADETAIELTAICDLQLFDNAQVFFRPTRYFPAERRAARGNLKPAIYGAPGWVRLTKMGEMAMIFPNQAIGPARRAGGDDALVCARHSHGRGGLPFGQTLRES
jgi:hypothetical protein